MSVTTIKVDSSVRDRLADIARARGISLGALLARVAQWLEHHQRWATIQDAYEQKQRDDPNDWQDYLTDLAQWHIAGSEPDTAAAREWPEYNT